MLVIPVLLLSLFAQFPVSGDPGETPEQRAIDYLAVEVARWRQENKCLSCHNNGDGARALYAAIRLGYRVPAEALEDTTQWLRQPSRWDTNRSDSAFSDQKLARIQFAAALGEAFDAKVVRDRTPLLEAARMLLPDQDADGCWRVDTESPAASPATYGPFLATYLARRALERADSREFRDAIDRANRWLLAAKPRSNLDAAALLLAHPHAQPILQRNLERLLRAQTSDGGWGPQPSVPAEVFDTAIVLLALAKVDQPNRTKEAVRRGRDFLIRQQQATGGWPETTRPSGAQSYAEHISTSGWATLALLTTDPKRQ
jgi:hypothetical protein